MVSRVLIAIVSTVAIAGCAPDAVPPNIDPTVGEPSSQCMDDIASVPVPLVPNGNPPPDVSRLVMCTDRNQTLTVVANSSDDAWLVQTTDGAELATHGAVPTAVQVFRSVRSPVPVPGYLLEPGTALRAATLPERIELRIDPTVQNQWSTFLLLDNGFTAARENLPDLIRNQKYQKAVKSCLEEGVRIANYSAATRFDTQDLIGGLGLVTGGTLCYNDLVVAAEERRIQTGRVTTELKPHRFAANASKIASNLDELLRHVGQLVRMAT